MFRNLSFSRATFLALFAGLITAGITLPVQVHAQAPAPEADDADVPVVVVTGSAIRRIEGESSLPVQVLDAEAIERTGASSIVDLIQRLPTVSGQSVESDAVGGSTFGFSGVSLHNIGENRTLVLLNGRRMAQFGGQTLTGFAAAVDLNVLPISAIDRVEILSDGASSLYGSDAIAGVVNFITKSKVTERDVSISYYAPKDGAEERGVSLTGGIGDYEADGWNLFLSAAFDDRDPLSSQDRDFANSAIINFEREGGLWTFFNGSSRGIPANVLTDSFELVNLGFLSGNGCPEKHQQVDRACYYDYVRDIEIYPERERKTASGSLNIALGEQNNVFVDALWSRAEQVSRVAPVPGELLIPFGSPLFNQYLAGVTDNGTPLFTGDVVAPFRAADLGQRINEDRADFYHFTAGLQGMALNWDYELAVGQSESDVKGTISGYPGALAFANALAGGNIDPFVPPGQQSEAGQADLEAINYRGYFDGGVARLQTAEVRASRALFDLPNGNPVMFAFGLSQYREKFQSKPSLFAQAALADPVAGTPAPGGPGTGDQRFGDSSASIPYGANRKVFGAFVEASVQPAEWMELTGSVRRDDYDDVGNSTNYKASFRITPTETLLFRGSYGTGFHAPTVPQLNATIQNYGVTSTPYDCSPALQAIATSLGAICRPPQSQYDVFAAGNPDLQPEESRQGCLGAVWEVAPRISLGADWWWVGIEDAFGQIVETAAFGDPTRYPDSWTTFTDIGTGTTYIALDQSNVNTGKEYYSGIDFNIQARWDTGFGRIRSTLLATHMLKNALQLAEDGPYFENISDYSADLDTPTFRWGGKLTTSLEHGP